MRISNKGIQFIANWEGKRNKRYKCSAGLWTIGIGHVIKSHESFKEPISEQEIQDLFRRDIAGFEAGVSKLVKVAINQNQFDALVSFTFNCGLMALEKSTLLRLLNAKNYTGASNEFLKWVNAGGKPVLGLQRRREAERSLFLRSD